jgi:hypothetical protein
MQPQIHKRTHHLCRLYEKTFRVHKNLCLLLETRKKFSWKVSTPFRENNFWIKWKVRNKPKLCIVKHENSSKFCRFSDCTKAPQGHRENFFDFIFPAKCSHKVYNLYALLNCNNSFISPRQCIRMHLHRHKFTIFHFPKKHKNSNSFTLPRTLFFALPSFLHFNLQIL